jgi:Uma2 family endonuclease
LNKLFEQWEKMMTPIAFAASELDSNGPVLVPVSAHTLAGFRAWAKSDRFPDRGRISFIDKEILIDMSPEELENHGKVKFEIGRVLGSLNRRMKRGQFYPDGTLVSNVDANLSTVPDGTFVKWSSLETGRVRLIPREGEYGEYSELEGTPDWVLEVVSKSSVTKDTQLLRRRYFQAGIPEYWLVNARGKEIDFQILTRRDTDYVPSAASGDWQRSRVFLRKFRLVRRRGRMNFWEYTLRVKSLR